MKQRFTDLDEVPIGEGKDDLENVAKLLLHTADLSHPVKSLAVFSQWSTKVC